jgi:hypothetical protein
MLAADAQLEVLELVRAAPTDVPARQITRNSLALLDICMCGTVERPRPLRRTTARNLGRELPHGARAASDCADLRERQSRCLAGDPVDTSA